MSADFHKYACLEEKFLYLNGKSVPFARVSEIIWKFIQNDGKNYNKIRNNLCQFFKIYFNTFILTYILRCIVQLKEQVSI